MSLTVTYRRKSNKKKATILYFSYGGFFPKGRIQGLQFFTAVSFTC